MTTNYRFQHHLKIRLEFISKCEWRRTSNSSTKKRKNTFVSSRSFPNGNLYRTSSYCISDAVNRTCPVYDGTIHFWKYGWIFAQNWNYDDGAAAESLLLFNAAKETHVNVSFHLIRSEWKSGNGVSHVRSARKTVTAWPILIKVEDNWDLRNWKIEFRYGKRLVSDQSTMTTSIWPFTGI